MSLLSRIQRYVSAVAAAHEEAQTCSHCAKMQADVDRLTRIKNDYWDVIEKLNTQRDMWCTMYNQACSGHLQAQTILEAALIEARVRLGKAIGWLNEYKDKAGEQSPVVPPPDHIDPSGAPIGTRERYEQFLRDLDARVPMAIDGRAERAAVAAKHGDTPPPPKVEP